MGDKQRRHCVANTKLLKLVLALVGATWLGYLWGYEPEAVALAPVVHRRLRALDHGKCNWVFAGYEPSSWEQFWSDNVEQLQHKVCENILKARPLVEAWVAGAADSVSGGGAFSDVSSGRTGVFSQTFSRLHYRNSCTGEVQTRWIEPLAGTTRHPYAICIDGTLDMLFSREFLVLQGTADLPRPAGSKNFYFDLGASVFTTGVGGASQEWIVNKYRKVGVEFDDIYAWEATEQKNVDVWKQIPAELKPRYHWYNIPASPEPQSPDNPLSYIQQVAKPEDFVVLKLDIDNSEAEMAFIQQLRGSAKLMNLVDEVFFEHHVNVSVMWPYWVSEHEKQTLVDTYRLFTHFRHSGIRFHSWP